MSHTADRVTAYRWIQESFRRGAGFLWYVIRQFRKDRCELTASALALGTLGALVPLAMVSFSVLATLPTFEGMDQEIQEFIFENFVPATGQAIQEHFTSFVRKALHLRLVGTLLFILVALLLVALVDKTINDIYKVKSRRPGTRAFLLYWTSLTLGPVLLGLSVGLTSYSFSVPIVAGTLRGLASRGIFFPFVAFLLAITILTFLYVVVPNRKVPLHHALSAAAVAAVLFELAKRGFTYYVRSVPTFEVVYGTLGVLPLFVLWVYLSWIIVLFGAQISHGMGTFRRQIEVGPAAKFEVGLKLIGHLWNAQKQSRSLCLEELARLESKVPETTIRELLSALIEEARLVGQLRNGEYLLQSDPRQFTIAELCRAVPWHLPRERTLEWEGDFGRVADVFDQLLKKSAETLDQTLNVSLESFFEGSLSEPGCDISS